MSRLGGCALGFLGFEQQVDCDQKVVAVERCSWDGVDVVNNVAPVLVYDGMVELNHVSVGAFVGVSVLWCFVHPTWWKAIVLRGKEIVELMLVCVSFLCVVCFVFLRRLSWYEVVAHCVREGRKLIQRQRVEVANH